LILPIGDQPNPRGFTPVVNYALIAINVAVFVLISLPLTLRAPDVNDPATQAYLHALLRDNPTATFPQVATLLRQMSAYDIFVLQWGYRPGAPNIFTLFTSMFLHGGWLHLIGNMLFLWIYGDNIEHRMGRLRYLLAYLGTGAAATLTYAAIAPARAAGVPLVGASGAISGVLGLYFLWFPRNKVRLLVLLFPFFFDVWTVGARLVLGFFLIVDNLLPLLVHTGHGGGVAHGAHIGGFFAGLALAFVANRTNDLMGRRRARKRTRPARAPQPTVAPATSGVDSVEEAYRRGDPGGAVVTYLDLSPSERRRVPVPLIADLADWLADNGQADAALALLRRGVSDHPQAPETGRLLLGIGLVLLYAKKRPTAAYQYLLDTLDVNPAPEVEQLARQAIAEIDRMQKMPIHRPN